MPENNRKMQTDISELENGQLAEQQLPSDFTLVVLAGGASSHMGREKSDLLLDGQTFLKIQIGKGCQLGAKQILISGYRGTQCGEEIVPDRISGQGPLGGLESCFRRAKTEKCLVLGGRYAAGTCGRTSKSVEVRNGKSRPTGDYAVS